MTKQKPPILYAEYLEYREGERRPKTAPGSTVLLLGAVAVIFWIAVLGWALV